MCILIVLNNKSELSLRIVGGYGKTHTIYIKTIQNCYLTLLCFEIFVLVKKSDISAINAAMCLISVGYRLVDTCQI